MLLLTNDEGRSDISLVGSPGNGEGGVTWFGASLQSFVQSLNGFL